MSHFDPRTGAPSNQVVSMLLIVMMAAGIGFGLGRESGGHHAAHFGTAVPPASAGVAYRGFWVHDDSVPDTAETLSQERLADDDSSPTF